LNNHPAWTANNITSTVYCTVTSTAEVRLVALDFFMQLNSTMVSKRLVTVKGQRFHKCSRKASYRPTTCRSSSTKWLHAMELTIIYTS